MNGCENKVQRMGSGCDSVGRAVTSDTRDSRFESRHRYNFIYQIIYQLFSRKNENKENEAKNCPSLKKEQRIADRCIARSPKGKNGFFSK